MTALPVTKVQRFCTHDGPGLRTTVFLKGCPLRCKWCHNPETQNALPEYFYTDRLCIRCGGCERVCPRGVHVISVDSHTLARDRCARCMQCAQVCPAQALESCQTLMTPEEILQEVLKDKAFYSDGGGVTFSGGEPMAHGEETIRLLHLCKEAGLHTAIETCGYFDAKYLEALVPVTDLFLWDIKDTNRERHQHYTGVYPDKIWHNLLQADQMDAHTILRCIMVRGVNMEDAHYQGICDLYARLRHCRGVELLPYHTYGQGKAEQLSLDAPAQLEWIPTNKDMQAARKALRPHVKLL